MSDLTTENKTNTQGGHEERGSLHVVDSPNKLSNVVDAFVRDYSFGS